MNWNSVDKALPKPGERYLVLLKHESDLIKPAFFSIDIFRFCWCKGWMETDAWKESLNPFEVVAWTELPQIPQELIDV